MLTDSLWVVLNELRSVLTPAHRSDEFRQPAVSPLIQAVTMFELSSVWVPFPPFPLVCGQAGWFDRQNGRSRQFGSDRFLNEFSSGTALIRDPSVPCLLIDVILVWLVAWFGQEGSV